MNKEKAIKQMKEDFPNVWGMTYEEFEEKINNPKMKYLVKEFREKFD